MRVVVGVKDTEGGGGVGECGVCNFRRLCGHGEKLGGTRSVCVASRIEEVSIVCSPDQDAI